MLDWLKAEKKYFDKLGVVVITRGLIRGDRPEGTCLRGQA